MPSYTIRATDKETGEVRLMKVQARTPMTEVIKQYAALSGIDESECRFLVRRAALVSNALMRIPSCPESPVCPFPF